MIFVIPFIVAMIVGNDSRDQAECRDAVRIEYSEPSAADYRRECIIGDRATERAERDPLQPLHQWGAGDEQSGPGGQVSATSRIDPHDIIFRPRERTWRPRER